MLMSSREWRLLKKDKATAAESYYFLEQVITILGNPEQKLRLIAALLFAMRVVMGAMPMFTFLALAITEMNGSDRCIAGNCALITVMMRHNPLAHKQCHCHEYRRIGYFAKNILHLLYLFARLFAVLTILFFRDPQREL